MRLLVLNCLLLASVAVALPNGQHKRHLTYLKNLVSSALGGPQINIQAPSASKEKNGYKLFHLPGIDDVMIKVARKKSGVKEFVYPSAQPVNINAFGKVVGTKSTGDTLVAVKDVDNLLSTGILYGGYNNVIKETIGPMFPAINTANYVVEEKIKTAPVIETRPILTEVRENRPVLTEVRENRPVFTEVRETRPVYTKVQETMPVYTEIQETRPVFTEIRENRPVFTEVRETKPVFTEVRETRPVLTEVREPRPVFTEVREATPVFTEVRESRPVFTEVREATPVLTEVREPRPVFTEVRENGPVFTEVRESRPVFTEVRENGPVFTEVRESSPVFTEVRENRPVLTEVRETRPVITEVREPRPVFTEVRETRPVLTEVREPRPVFTEVRESRPVFTEVRENGPVFTEVREPRPVLTEVTETRPVLTEVIETRPFEEKVELEVPVFPSYSYKQIQNNQPVMTYTGYNSPGVEVLETLKMKTELPMCIKKRVDEAIVLGADPKQFAPVQEVVQYQTVPGVDFSYPRVEPYVQNSFREEVLTEGFGTVADFGLPPQRFRPMKDRPVRYNLRPTKTQAINPHPLPLNSHKSLHLEENISSTKDKVNSQTNQVQAFTNLGDKVNISQTLGPIPPQYIRHVSNKENAAELSRKSAQQMKFVPIASSKDRVSNAQIPNKVYTLQRNLNTGKVVTATNDLRTNVKSPNHYVIAPTVNREAPKKDTVQVKNVVYTNKVTAKPQNVPSPAAAGSNEAKLNLLRENVQPSFKNNPIVLEAVKDYSYHQKNADGSSLNVKGSKHGVSVDVKQKNNAGRGDIPDQ